MNVHDLPLPSLKANGRNPRTHSPKQIGQIADSIRTFGFTNPILIDGDRRVIAGHGRLMAAKQLGLERVPTIRLDHMTPAQIRAYAIADNKLAENAGWDRDLLALEFGDLAELNLDFDLTITGFETAEIDLLIEGSDASVSAVEDDRIPFADDSAPPVSRPGDLWRIGRHRLLCGDARVEASFRRLLRRRRAEMVFIDPPYNVPIDGHVSGRGRTRHGAFAMAAGEMSESAFTAFLSGVLGHLVAFSADGSIHFVCMDWRHAFELLTAARAHYAETKNLCVWAKTNAGMGSLYRSRHELVFVFKNGTAPHVNNVELGRHGRSRTNVWAYPGTNTFREGRLEELAMHPTVKPVALVADAIRDCSNRRGLVLDCFAGSGTTLVAAERTGRRAFGMEIDPRYVDTTIERFCQLTGEAAVLSATGQSFAEVKAERQKAKRTPIGRPTRREETADVR